MSLNFTGAFTVGGWWWFDAPSMGAEVGLINKWLTAGNLRSYRLIKTAGDVLQAEISSNGTGAQTVASSVTPVVDGWYLVAARYDPSNALTIFVNGTFDTNDTAIPAAIYDTTAPFEMGRSNLAAYFDGRLGAYAFACEQALSDDVLLNLLWQTEAILGVKV